MATAHNAGFDIAFLNAELKRAAKPPIATERVVDTLVLARRRHPGRHNTLDDLSARYGVDTSFLKFQWYNENRMVPPCCPRDRPATRGLWLTIGGVHLCRCHRFAVVLWRRAQAD